MSLLPYMYNIERPFHMMEKDLFKPDDFFSSPFNQLVPRDFFAPQFFKPWENMLRPWETIVKPMEQISAAMNHLVMNDPESKITSDNEKFQVIVDVQHFAPEEISVKVIDGDVIVEGKHDDKRDEHGYVSRRFVRRYILPKGCLPDTVVSKLSSDGVLTVTAPKVLAMPSTGERIIPITHTGPIQKKLGSPMVDVQ